MLLLYNDIIISLLAVYIINMRKVQIMWIEYIVLFSIAIMVFSIMVVLTVETVHTTKRISKKRSSNEPNKLQ